MHILEHNGQHLARLTLSAQQYVIFCLLHWPLSLARSLLYNCIALGKQHASKQQVLIPAACQQVVISSNNNPLHMLPEVTNFTSARTYYSEQQMNAKFSVALD
jgi:hypothetical protein